MVKESNAVTGTEDMQLGSYLSFIAELCNIDLTVLYVQVAQIHFRLQQTHRHIIFFFLLFSGKNGRFEARF
jgi:hypothetical protein